MAENGVTALNGDGGENGGAHFFEGAEKLLEIWFASNPEDENADLRQVTRSVWETLLQAVKCEIISFTRNEHIDAYVLSESSMFVSKRRWILKTCGTTTLLQCIQPLLEIATQQGFNEIEDLYYSRKNFDRPELQLFPHRGISEEFAILDVLFKDGRSYCFGSINRDCWYLYTYSMKKKKKNQAALAPRHIEDDTDREPDQTIEIIMKNLDKNAMSIFTKANSSSAEEATTKAGIHNIIPGMKIDDYLFEPCGYSMNGISDNGQYMTIHITPEHDFSYVSFESNITLSNYAALIGRVVTTFQPEKFMITIFANQTSEAYTSLQDLEHTEILSKWNRTDMQYSHFPSYNLIFAQYKKD